MDREAKIKLIAEGASRAASGVREVKSEVSGLGKVAEGAQSALKEIGKAAFHAASDYARVANDTRPISFQSAADSAKRFDDVVTRLAVRSNRDIGALKLSFRETGKEIGVLPERVANAARALTKMTGSTDAAEAMRDLGTEANDTDRSIEEMTEVGATLYNKLGVPLSRVGDALKGVRSTAEQFATTGGHLALENSLVRLAPLLARFGGGERRASAFLGVFGKGKSREVAEETTAAILAGFGDHEQITRFSRKVFGAKYKPLEYDAQGRAVPKMEILKAAQRELKRRPYGAALRQFHGNVTATETFLNADLSQIDTEEARREFEDDTWANRAFDKAAKQEEAKQDALRQQAEKARREEARKNWPKGHSATPPSLGSDSGEAPPKPPKSFRETAAGVRAGTDVERSEVELDVGDESLKSADRRNAFYRGHRGVQAAIDTGKNYVPSVAERGADIAEWLLLGSEGAREEPSRRGQASEGRAPPTVRLDAASQRGLASDIAGALRSAPVVVRSGNSPAAQATEDSKRALSGAANH